MQDQVQVCSGMQNDVCGCLEDTMDATGWLMDGLAPGNKACHATWEPTYWGHPKNVTNMHQNASKCHMLEE